MLLMLTIDAHVFSSPSPAVVSGIDTGLCWRDASPVTHARLIPKQWLIRL